MNSIRNSRGHGQRRFALACGLLVTVALSLPVAFAAPAAAAPAPTFTWTGFDANLGNTNWSSGANWVGGVAPTAPGPVNLLFPAPVTCTTPNCAQSTNDLTDLIVEDITVVDRPNIRLSGNEITLTGGVSITSTPGVDFSLPIALTAPSATWTVDDSAVSINRQVAGPTHLTVTIGNGSSFGVGATVGVGTASLVLAGADPNAAAPADNGTVRWESGQAPTAIRHLALEAQGAFLGSHFATEHADITVTGLYWRAVRADITVQGNAALDPATSLVVTRYAVVFWPPTFPSSTHLSGLKVAGSLDLASAALTVDLANSCLPIGLTLPFATSAPNALLGAFTQPVAGGGQQPLPDGAVIAGINAPACGSGTSSFLRIDYDHAAGTVTATAVAPPTIGVETSHSPTVPGSPVTYTATITPAPADGTASFVDNGTVITGCEARPVNPTTGQATCPATYDAPGNHVVSASYDGGTAMPPVGPSASITQVVVPAPTAVITSPSGMSVVGTPIEGTASDVGGPGLLGVVLYFHSYTGGPSGAVVVDCDTCGPGQTSTTWAFTPPPGSIPGIYSFVAQAYDVAGNAGPVSNVIYQLIV